MNALARATTAIFLVVAPFAGSAGSRMAMLLLAAFALVVLQVRGEGFDFTTLPRAVIATLGAWALIAVASLAWSVQPAYTLGELRPEVAYGVLAFAVFLLASRDTTRWPTWWKALLVGALLMLVAHLLQRLLPFRLSRHAFMGQAGLWSTHLVLIAPLLLVLGWPAPWGAARSTALQGAALLLLFGAAWATANRVVWLALGVQVALAVALSGAVFAADRERHRRLRAMLLVAALVVAAGFVVSMKDRIAFASPGASLGASIERDSRPRIWAAAWEYYLEAPWLGHGFGREILGPELKGMTPRALKHPPVLHAHNVFIDMALQLGAVGLAAFVALLAALARQYRAFLRDSRVAPLGILGLMMLAGFIVKNLTDDFLHRHNALVFWALNGMLIGLGRVASRPAPPPTPPG